jgi:hypothetical protein
MVNACKSLCRGAGPKVTLLLESLCSEIESTVLGETRMEKRAKELIRQLWANPDHRRAMRFIIECVPTPRKLWETDLFKRVAGPLKARGIQLPQENPIDLYPESSESPREIKFYCSGKFGEAAERAGFALAYMLHSGDKHPDIGSEFVVRLVAWYESDRARQRVKDMQLGNELATSGPLRHWSSWENIWTSGPYIIRDFGKLDVKGMAKLLLDGVDQTWPALAKRVSKLPK